MGGIVQAIAAVSPLAHDSKQHKDTALNITGALSDLATILRTQNDLAINEDQRDREEDDDHRRATATAAQDNMTNEEHLHALATKNKNQFNIKVRNGTATLTDRHGRTTKAHNLCQYPLNAAIPGTFCAGHPTCTLGPDGSPVIFPEISVKEQVHRILLPHPFWYFNVLCQGCKALRRHYPRDQAPIETVAPPAANVMAMDMHQDAADAARETQHRADLEAERLADLENAGKHAEVDFEATD